MRIYVYIYHINIYVYIYIYRERGEGWKNRESAFEPIQLATLLAIQQGYHSFSGHQLTAVLLCAKRGNGHVTCIAFGKGRMKFSLNITYDEQILHNHQVCPVIWN